MQDNGGDYLAIGSDGSFSFATPVASGSTYAVTVLTNPTVPSQTCTVTAGTGSGTVTTANVTNVAVICATNTYTIGGTLSGLADGESVVLQDNGTNNLILGANGNFVFTTPIPSGSAFAVTVLTQPSAPSEACLVSGGTGTVVVGNVTTVTVNCTVDFTIGGSVNGLAGSGLVLQDNGGDNLSVTANGTFAFATLIASGNTYAVTVLTQPASQYCVVTFGGGTVTDANIATAVVTCASSTCPAETTNNCIVTTTNSGNTDTGTCAAGYTGSCSLSCGNGTWTQVTDTCAAQCVAGTINNCIVTTTNSGSTDNGTCSAGYAGACAYSCRNGTWTQVTGTLCQKEGVDPGA